MENRDQPGVDNTLVIHYLTLRQLIGILGILLPVFLIVGSFLTECKHIEASISDFYYTRLRDVFVVTLSAVSLFLFTYKGYDPLDKIMTNLAGVFGLVVAFFPTTFYPGICVPCFSIYPSRVPAVLLPCYHGMAVGAIHLTAASLFFITLAFISFFLFTKVSETGTPTPQKIVRNRIYRICACIMIGCILLLVPYFTIATVKSHLDRYNLVFWMETIALWAFGTSWLIKGEFILKDKPMVA